MTPLPWVLTLMLSEYVYIYLQVCACLPGSLWPRELSWPWPQLPSPPSLAVLHPEGRCCRRIHVAERVAWSPEVITLQLLLEARAALSMINASPQPPVAKASFSHL